MGGRVDTGAPVLWVTGQGLEPGSPFPVQQMFGAERARVERSPRSSRLRAPSRLPGPPDLGSPDLGQVWGVVRTPAPCLAPSWSAEAAALDRPEPLLQQLLTRTARGQASCHLRDPRHGQKKQQRTSPGSRDRRHVRAGGLEPRDARTQPGSRGCSRKPRPGGLDLY